MASIVPGVQCIRQIGVVAMVWWAYLLKGAEFRFTVTVLVTKVSRVSRVSIRIKVRFSL